MTRRYAAAALLAGCATPAAAPALPASSAAPDLLAPPPVPRLHSCSFDALWRGYASRYLSQDGRVVEFSQHARTTSEGQAYALALSLVAGDRATFDRVLRWTGDNLGRGLPAWLFGEAKDGTWRVLDSNSAADADVWMAWALLEGGRIWNDEALSARGAALAALIARSEVAELPGLGAILLPGARGFFSGANARLNPSYFALPPLRRLALSDAGGPWEAVAGNARRVLIESAPMGIAPDWIGWRDGRLAPEKNAVASYDAIRVPLWAGMEDDADLQRAAAGWLRFKAVPEKIDPRTAEGSDRDGPPGFSAALLPLARALGDEPRADALRERALSPMPTYYDQNLTLFAIAWDEGRARFDAQGRLAPLRSPPCSP